jgi:GMP synthase-like glutamine amidotransferase
MADGRPAVVLVDNREESDCAEQKSTTVRLQRHLEEACARHGAALVVVRGIPDVARLLESRARVACAVLGGSSLNLSTRIQMRSIAHATAVVTRFPEAACFGTCFGMQLLATLYGGNVTDMPEPVTGWVDVWPVDGLPTPRYCNHGDVIASLPPGFRMTHTNARGHVMGMESTDGRRVRGVQYHPEADAFLPEELDGFVRDALRPRSRL